MESLNPDVLLELFEYLDSESLKSSALVCKQWDSIIGSSATTMRKLPLIFRSNWEHRKGEIKGLRRKFHTVLLDSVDISNYKLSKALKKIGSNVRCLELEQVQVNHRSFKDILDSLTMLEKLIISESDIDMNEVETITACSLKALKSVIIIQSDWLFFDFILNTQVQNVKVAQHFSNPNDEAFKEFLAKNSSLESLAIHARQGEIYKTLALYEEKKFKFKLKQLSVDFKYWGDDASVDDAFIEFLKHHQSTLQNLETQRKLSEKVLEFIMKNLKIQRLIIEADLLPASPLFYNSIRPNKHLKTLIVKGELVKFEAARGLLHIYQSTEKLVIINWKNEIINEVLIFIANNLKALSFLEIPTLMPDTPELPIPSLKTLHVDFVDDVSQWQTICVNNPSIEQVNVKWLMNRNTFTYEVMDTVTSRLQNLKHIRFGAYFKPTMRILELMARNCPSLRLLEVFADDEAQSGANTNLGQFKVVYFPHEAVTKVFKEEPTMWSEEKNYVLESDSGTDFSDDDDMDDYDAVTDEDSEMGWDDDDGGFDFDNLIYYY